MSSYHLPSCHANHPVGCRCSEVGRCSKLFCQQAVKHQKKTGPLEKARTHVASESQLQPFLTRPRVRRPRPPRWVERTSDPVSRCASQCSSQIVHGQGRAASTHTSLVSEICTPRLRRAHEKGSVTRTFSGSLCTLPHAPTACVVQHVVEKSRQPGKVGGSRSPDSRIGARRRRVRQPATRAQQKTPCAPWRRNTAASDQS